MSVLCQAVHVRPEPFAISLPSVAIPLGHLSGGEPDPGTIPTKVGTCPRLGPRNGRTNLACDDSDGDGRLVVWPSDDAQGSVVAQPGSGPGTAAMLGIYGSAKPRNQPNILTLLCALICQGVFGLGGQDWVGRHRVGGRLLWGHTALADSGWGRQVNMRTAP